MKQLSQNNARRLGLLLFVSVAALTMPIRAQGQPGEPTVGQPIGLSGPPSMPDTMASQDTESALPVGMLVERLRTTERAAASEASEIRKLQKGGKNTSAIKDRQLRLSGLLKSAFDLKMQIEEAQIKELQARLARLERQIGQRRALAAKIIERRAQELIEGNATKWEPVQSDAVADTTNSNPLASKSNDPNSIGGETTQVQISDSTSVGLQSLPIVSDFQRGTRETTRYHFQVSQSILPSMTFSGLLEIHPVNDATKLFLSHNQVPFEVTDEDIGQLKGNNLVVKVAYLALPSAKQREASIELLVSSRLDAGVDPVLEAKWRGEILAVLRLAPDRALFDDLAAPADVVGAKRNVLSLRSSRPSALNQKENTIEQFDASFSSFQDFASRLATMDSTIEQAEEILRSAERDAGKAVAVDSVPNARRRLELAIRSRKAIQDEYAAVLSDLQLQVEAAQAEVDDAKQNVKHSEALFAAATVTSAEVVNSQYRLKQAELILERLKIRYELYKKAGSDSIFESDLLGTTAHPTSPISETYAKEANSISDNASEHNEATPANQPSLEFRIAAQPSDSPFEPHVLQGANVLTPAADAQGFVWVTIAGSTKLGLPIEMDHGERRVALLADTPEHSLALDELWAIEDCKVIDDPNGRENNFMIELALDETGGAEMRTLTKNHLNQQLAIVINKEIITAPMIRSEIGNRIAITGNFTREQAEALASQLRSLGKKPE